MGQGRFLILEAILQQLDGDLRLALIGLQIPLLFHADGGLLAGVGDDRAAFHFFHGRIEVLAADGFIHRPLGVGIQARPGVGPVIAGVQGLGAVDLAVLVQRDGHGGGLQILILREDIPHLPYGEGGGGFVVKGHAGYRCRSAAGILCDGTRRHQHAAGILDLYLDQIPALVVLCLLISRESGGNLLVHAEIIGARAGEADGGEGEITVFVVGYSSNQLGLGAAAVGAVHLKLIRCLRGLAVAGFGTVQIQLGRRDAQGRGVRQRHLLVLHAAQRLTVVHAVGAFVQVGHVIHGLLAAQVQFDGSILVELAGIQGIAEAHGVVAFVIQIELGYVAFIGHVEDLSVLGRAIHLQHSRQLQLVQTFFRTVQLEAGHDAVVILAITAAGAAAEDPVPEVIPYAAVGQGRIGTVLAPDLGHHQIFAFELPAYVLYRFGSRQTDQVLVHRVDAVVGAGKRRMV